MHPTPSPNEEGHEEPEMLVKITPEGTEGLSQALTALMLHSYSKASACNCTF